MSEHADVAYFWPFGRLGLATYFLAIGFLLMSALSLQMFAKVKTLIRTWNAHLIFHLGLGVLCVARCVAFGVLTAFSFASVKDNNALYPLYIMLFTLPEFVCLIIYSLLFFNWYARAVARGVAPLISAITDAFSIPFILE